MQSSWPVDGNFSLFLTTVSNSLRGTNYVLWPFIKYSCPPPPALLVGQEARKWPGRRRILFPPRRNLQRQPGSGQRKRRGPDARTGLRERPWRPLSLLQPCLRTPGAWNQGSSKDRMQGCWVRLLWSACLFSSSPDRLKPPPGTQAAQAHSGVCILFSDPCCVVSRATAKWPVHEEMEDRFVNWVQRV